jgi:hypothetical protein
MLHCRVCMLLHLDAQLGLGDMNDQPLPVSEAQHQLLALVAFNMRHSSLLLYNVSYASHCNGFQLISDRTVAVWP